MRQQDAANARAVARARATAKGSSGENNATDNAGHAGSSSCRQHHTAPGEIELEELNSQRLYSSRDELEHSGGGLRRPTALEVFHQGDGPEAHSRSLSQPAQCETTRAGGASVTPAATANTGSHHLRLQSAAETPGVSALRQAFREKIKAQLGTNDSVLIMALPETKRYRLSRQYYDYIQHVEDFIADRKRVLLVKACGAELVHNLNEKIHL